MYRRWSKIGLDEAIGFGVWMNQRGRKPRVAAGCTDASDISLTRTYLPTYQRRTHANKTVATSPTSPSNDFSRQQKQSSNDATGINDPNEAL